MLLPGRSSKVEGIPKEEQAFTHNISRVIELITRGRTAN